MNWVHSSWWSPVIGVLGGVLLLSLLFAHYWRSRRRSLLLILIGIALFPVSYVLQIVVQTHDVRELPGGILDLIPRPWHAVCEGVVVLGHACIFVGLLGEVFPKVAERLERIRTEPTPPVPGA